MSRGAATEAVTVAPTNNIYTALAAAALVATAVGLIVLFVRASAIGIKFF
jgi:hypothetical protein